MPDITLVTGASGFVGPYVVAALTARGDRVVALHGPEHLPEHHAGPWPPPTTCEWRPLHLTSRESVFALVEAVRPARVVHLAALASVAASFEDPTPTFETNVLGTLHLLEAVRRYAPTARVLLVSSAEVYGGLGSPQTEATPLAPASPYAASKAAAEMIAIQEHRAHGLDVVRARAYNHTGPGQSARFAVPAFARQIARIEVARQSPVLGVGNLGARRDFLDVRDVASAYVALLAHGRTGDVYNVCSGQAVTMQSLLDRLVAMARVGIAVERDPALDRPLDIPELRGDPMALMQATGWKPLVSLEQTLADVLAYWRAREPFVGDAAPSWA